MEEYVERRRQGCENSLEWPPSGQDGVDGIESGMQVPTSALNDCKDSFMAADEKWQKSSTQFFTDTGLMALLCHHDRVL